MESRAHNTYNILNSHIIIILTNQLKSFSIYIHQLCNEEVYPLSNYTSPGRLIAEVERRTYRLQLTGIYRTDRITQAVPLIR